VQQWPFARSVAIVSDIHELVRESVLEAVSQVDLILHAGDVYDFNGTGKNPGFHCRYDGAVSTRALIALRNLRFF